MNSSRKVAEKLSEIDEMRALFQPNNPSCFNPETEPNPSPKDPELICRLSLVEVKKNALKELEDLLDKVFLFLEAVLIFIQERIIFDENILDIEQNLLRLKELEESVSQLTDTHLDKVNLN